MWKHLSLAGVIVTAISSFLISGAVEAGDPKLYSLAPKERKGRVLAIDEQKRFEYQETQFKNDTRLTKSQGRSRLVSSYTEEVVSSEPRSFKRQYESSQRSTGKGRANKRQPDPSEATKLEGKTLVIDADGPQLEGDSLSEAESLEFLLYGRLTRVLLPTGPVSVGESWKPSSQAVSAVFFGTSDPRKALAKVKSSFKSVKEKNGRKVGSLKFELDLKHKSVDGGPALSYKLKGTGLFDIEEGYIAELELKGSYKSIKSEIKLARTLKGQIRRNRYTTTIGGKLLIGGRARLIAAGDAKAEDSDEAEKEDGEG